MEVVHHWWAERDVCAVVIVAIWAPQSTGMHRAGQEAASLYLLDFICDLHRQGVGGESLPFVILILYFYYACAVIHRRVEACSTPYRWPVVVGAIGEAHMLSPFVYGVSPMQSLELLDEGCPINFAYQFVVIC